MSKNSKKKYFECKDCDYISGNLGQMNDHFSRFSHSEKSPMRGFFETPAYTGGKCKKKN